MNVARLNLSHGSYESHLERAERIRSVAEDCDVNVAIMADTKGFEIRTGRVRDGRVPLQRGADFSLLMDGRLGDENGVSISYDGLAEKVSSGLRILIDDGKLELEVKSSDAGEIQCRIIRGGPLKDHRGINIPDLSLGFDSLEGDPNADLHFAMQAQVDYIAASFVRSADDIETMRSFLKSSGHPIPLIAKIENREAVDNLQSIVAVSDGTMVARGDLGVELPLREVPIVQKKIIRATVTNGKPVITATQMLDSMERNETPTRAEVSDVANAIFDGTSAVMLSGETAAGQHPVEAVRTMVSLARQAEAFLPEFGHLQNILAHPANVITDAVSQAAITMAHHLNAAAIITVTESGFTSRSISKYRPNCPILAVTTSTDVVRKLAMNWGVSAYRYAGKREDHNMIRSCLQRAVSHGELRNDDVVVVTTGVAQESGSTNTIRVLRINDEL